MHRTNSKRYLRISEISLVDLSNASLLTGLDEFYSGRPAIAAFTSASMPLQPPSPPHRLSSIGDCHH